MRRYTTNSGLAVSNKSNHGPSLNFGIMRSPLLLSFCYSQRALILHLGSWRSMPLRARPILCSHNTLSINFVRLDAITLGIQQTLHAHSVLVLFAQKCQRTLLIALLRTSCPIGNQNGGQKGERRRLVLTWIHLLFIALFLNCYLPKPCIPHAPLWEV